MARAKLTETSTDLMSDSGAVLWSFVKGEQLEYPLTLSFISDVYAGYAFEAVVVEADNVAGQTDKPTAIKVGGYQNTLIVRVPVNRGTWAAAASYTRDEVVLYSGIYYTLLSGTNRVNATLPSVDPLWAVVADASTIYIQFPSTLGSPWVVQPTVLSNTYGFFELRVTEPVSATYPRTWKPVRGMVEIQFSPTDTV
jgi:hypothetical protein